VLEVCCKGCWVVVLVRVPERVGTRMRGGVVAGGDGGTDCDVRSELALALGELVWFVTLAGNATLAEIKMVHHEVMRNMISLLEIRICLILRSVSFACNIAQIHASSYTTLLDSLLSCRATCTCWSTQLSCRDASCQRLVSSLANMAISSSSAA
jgi:hypothetical protein